jgi:hypothetical protein
MPHIVAQNYIEHIHAAIWPKLNRREIIALDIRGTHRGE